MKQTDISRAPRYDPHAVVYIERAGAEELEALQQRYARGDREDEEDDEEASEEEEQQEENEAHPKRVVELLDAGTGEVLGRWSTAYAAGRELGIANVSAVLRGDQSAACGCRWRWRCSISTRSASCTVTSRRPTFS